MIYDRDKSIQDLKTRGFSACLKNIKTKTSGYVNIKELIGIVNHTVSTIRVMEFNSKIQPIDIFLSYDMESNTINEYSSIEELVDDGWRVD